MSWIWPAGMCWTDGSRSRCRRCRSRWRITVLFTKTSSLTGRGMRRRTTAMSTSRRWWCRTARGGPTPGDDGLARIWGGTGCPTNLSAGPAFITAAGPCWMDGAGCGCRGTSGRPPGYAGAKEASTSAGPRCPRRRLASGGAAGIAASSRSSGSARRASTSSIDGTWRIRRGAISCPSRGMPA